MAGYHKSGATCVECEANTYKAGKSQANSCTDCPPGRSTNGVTGSTDESDCTRK